jgi:hypothetical protein
VSAPSDLSAMRDLLAMEQSVPAESIFHPRRREFLAFVWLHWIVVNAAGLGSGAWVGTWLVKVYSDWALHLLLFIAGCLIVFALQGVVLRGAGLLAQQWVIFQCVSTAFGMVFALPLICVFSLGGGWLMFVANVTGYFCLGAGAGFIQAGLLNLNPEREKLWWLCNGLGMSAAYAAVYGSEMFMGLQLSRMVCPESLVATLAGGAYGIVSGWGIVQTLRRQNSLWQAMNAGKS